MDTSLLLAQVMGILFTTIGVGMALNMSSMNKLFADMLKSPGLLYFAGVLNLVLGSLVVLHHNIWTGGWVVLVTLIGWMALAKGFLWIVFPDQQAKIAKSVITASGIKLGTLVTLVLGIYLLYVGFVI